MPLIKKRAVKKKTPEKKRARLKKSAPEIETPVIEESKYYAGPVIQKFAEARAFELPAGYGDNRIVAMVRDPHWIHVYWEISERRRHEIQKEIDLARAKECL